VPESSVWPQEPDARLVVQPEAQPVCFPLSEPVLGRQPVLKQLPALRLAGVAPALTVVAPELSVEAQAPDAPLDVRSAAQRVLSLSALASVE
jgi:hypothetical protein